MSRRSGRRENTDEDAFPFWDEPDGRRRRRKKSVDKSRRDDDDRPRRPRFEDDLDDWEDDYEDSDWEAMSDDDLDLDDGQDDDWSEAGWDREHDEGEEDWRSQDDG